MAGIAGNSDLYNTLLRNPDAFGLNLSRHQGYQGAPQAPGAMPQDAASLQARYGNAPETFDQLATINGWNKPQAAPSPFSPAPSNPTAPGLTNSAPVPGGAPTGGGGGGDLMSQLIAQLQGYDPSAGINQAYELTKKQGLQSLGMDVEDNLAGRGVMTGSATGQDLQSRLTAQLLGPLQAQHAQALAGAQGDKLSRLQSLTGMQLDQQRAAQQQEYQRTRDAAEDAWRREQAGQAQAWQQKQWDAQQAQQQQASTWEQQLQKWQTEDRQRQQAALGPVGSNPLAGSLGGGGGGMTPEAEAARALIMGGSGGGSAPAAGGGMPLTSTGQPMGGGTGLSGANTSSGFGEKFGGFTGGHKWDGIDRSVGYKPFEGANTTTVGTSVTGARTNGSGTLVGSGSPFSNLQTGQTSAGLWGSNTAATPKQPTYSPAGYSPQGYPTVKRS